MANFDRTSPDGLLVAAALAGEEQALAMLVERYRGPLLKAARSRLNRPELAEEAVQEALLSAHRWLATYDSRFSFRTWLWTILLNQCTRLAKREAKHASPTRCGPAGQASAASFEPESAAASPLDVLLVHESCERVRGLLARLPQVQADALRLRFFGGLTFPEIAAAMGCSEPGAKHRVKSGLVTLSKWLVEASQRT